MNFKLFFNFFTSNFGILKSYKAIWCYPLLISFSLLFTGCLGDKGEIQIVSESHSDFQMQCETNVTSCTFAT